MSEHVCEYGPWHYQGDVRVRTGCSRTGGVAYYQDAALWLCVEHARVREVRVTAAELERLRRIDAAVRAFIPTWDSHYAWEISQAEQAAMDALHAALEVRS